MEKFITAVFDSEDAADFARIRLNRSGVRMSRCDILHAQRHIGDDDLHLVVDPYASMTAMSIDEATSGQAGMMGQFGGFLYLHGRGENSAFGSGIGALAHGGEVLMRILVDERDADLAESVLVSNHASHIRMG